MKRHILFIIFTCLTSYSFAQIHEVGVFLGGSNFIGDIGRTNYIYPNKISGGLVYKYNLNPRISLRANYNYIGIEGDNSDRESVLDEYKSLKIFNTIHELTVGTEFNFFDYNIRERSTSYTPYIMVSFGVFNYQTPDSFDSEGELITRNKISYTIPVGLGYKGRLGENLAFAIESSLHITFEDDIDYTTNRIPPSPRIDLNFGGSGKDFYVFTGFSIVYTFGRPPCYAYLEE